MQFSFPDGTGSFKCSGIVCAQEDVSKLFFYANNVSCTLLEMVVIFFFNIFIQNDSNKRENHFHV